MANKHAMLLALVCTFLCVSVAQDLTKPTRASPAYFKGPKPAISSYVAFKYGPGYTNGSAILPYGGLHYNPKTWKVQGRSDGTCHVTELNAARTGGFVYCTFADTWVDGQLLNSQQYNFTVPSTGYPIINWSGITGGTGKYWKASGELVMWEPAKKAYKFKDSVLELYVDYYILGIDNSRQTQMFPQFAPY